VPKRLERGALGAALEWLLMVVLMAYIFYLVKKYQSDKLAVPLSLEEAGSRGFSEIAAKEHISALVELGPHPVGTKALDKALMVVYRTLLSLQTKQSIRSSAKYYCIIYYSLKAITCWVIAQYVYSQLMEIKDVAYSYVDFEVDLFEASPGVERLDGGLFYGKSLVYANLRHIVVRISPLDFVESKENAVLISTHIDTVITS
jgi:hypothetical protein